MQRGAQVVPVTAKAVWVAGRKGGMTDDDWAPLPEGELCQRPGEGVAVPPRAAVAARAPVAPAAPVQAPSPALAPRPAKPAAKPVDPEAERALAALKAKIAAAAPATSLIADVQHRQLREERKRQAVGKVPELVAAVVAPPSASPPPAPAPAPEVVIDTAACEVDPRELEPWFKQLPASERERLRAQWWLERHRHDGKGLAVRRRLQRALGYGALVFLVLGLLQALLVGSVALVPMLTAAGAVAGGLAEILGGGRFVYAFAGAMAFVAVMGPMVLVQPLSLTSLLIACYGMGAIGMDGEMRRSGGFRDA